MFNGIQEMQDARKAQILAGIVPLKKVCAALVILIGKGEILLLLRQSEDAFCPSTWCLPGGGVDAGEDATEAVKREVLEEAGLRPLDYTLYKHTVIEVEEAILNYFVGVLHDDEQCNFVFIDQEEHSQYEWCDPKCCIEDKDLILDLGSHLQQILQDVNLSTTKVLAYPYT